MGAPSSYLLAKNAGSGLGVKISSFHGVPVGLFKITFKNQLVASAAFSSDSAEATPPVGIDLSVQTNTTAPESVNLSGSNLSRLLSPHALSPNLLDNSTPLDGRSGDSVPVVVKHCESRVGIGLELQGDSTSVCLLSVQLLVRHSILMYFSGWYRACTARCCVYDD